MKNLKSYLQFLCENLTILNLILVLLLFALTVIEKWTADPPLWELLLMLWTV